MDGKVCVKNHCTQLFDIKIILTNESFKGEAGEEQDCLLNVSQIMTAE